MKSIKYRDNCIIMANKCINKDKAKPINKAEIMHEIPAAM